MNKKNKVPKFDTSDSLGVMKALNWYNVNSNRKESRKYLLDFLLSMQLKSDLANIKRIPENELSTTYGYVAKLLLDGYTLPDAEQQRFDGYIVELSKQGLNVQPESAKKAVEKHQKDPSTKPWNYYTDVNSYIGEVEHQIDVFLHNDYRSDFSMYEFLKTLPGLINKHPKILEIKDVYLKHLKEILSAYEKTDTDLVEAYGYIPRRGLKRYVNFMETIVSDCDKYASYLKPKRKPRKSKTPNKMKMVKTFKYKPEDVDLGLRSEDPLGIPGSKQVWIFNTKNRLLFHYDAIDEKVGLSISGSSLKGYDKESSKCKKIKKPFDELQTIIKNSRSDLVDEFDKIPGKEFGNGQRVNNDMLILRIVK